MAAQSVAIISLVVLIVLAMIIVLSAAILHRRRVRMLKEQIPYQMSAQADLQGLASLNKPLFEEHKDYEELFMERPLVKGSKPPKSLLQTDAPSAEQQKIKTAKVQVSEFQGAHLAEQLEPVNTQEKPAVQKPVQKARKVLRQASKKDWHESTNLDEELQRIEEELARLQ